MKLHESPMFEQLRQSGGRSKAPFRESFGEWRSLRVVLIALGSMMVAQGAVWYTTFFYSQFFVERIVKVEPGTVNALMVGAGGRLRAALHLLRLAVGPGRPQAGDAVGHDRWSRSRSSPASSR